MGNIHRAQDGTGCVLGKYAATCQSKKCFTHIGAPGTVKPWVMGKVKECLEEIRKKCLPSPNICRGQIATRRGHVESLCGKACYVGRVQRMHFAGRSEYVLCATFLGNRRLETFRYQNHYVWDFKQLPSHPQSKS